MSSSAQTSPTAPLPGETAPLSEGARLVNTFVAPSKTFTDIRRNASWWVPWLLVSLMSIAFSYTFAQKVGWETMMEQQMAKNPSAQARMEQMKPEQRQQLLATQAKVAGYIGYASPLAHLLFLVVAGAIGMAIFNFGFGAQIPFKQSLSVFAYATLPLLISSALAIVMMYVTTTPETFNINNPIASNPAYALDPANSRLLYWLGSCLDVFGLWVIVLLGIGYSKLTPKVKATTAMVVFFVIYALFKGLGAIRA